MPGRGRVRVERVYDLARELKFELVNFSRRPTRRADSPRFEGFELPAEILDADVFISMPVLKTHVQGYFTGAIKNMWGCVPRVDRFFMHRHLHECLAELPRLLRPHFAIMDAIVAMEGMGPSYGDPRRLDLVLASRDVVALDATAMRLVGLDVAKARHIPLAAATGFGTMDDPRFKSTAISRRIARSSRLPSTIFVHWSWTDCPVPLVHLGRPAEPAALPPDQQSHADDSTVAVQARVDEPGGGTGGSPLPSDERRTLRRNAATLALTLFGGALATAIVGAVLVPPMIAVLIALMLVVCGCAVLLRRHVSLVSPLSLAVVTFVLSYGVRPMYLSLRVDATSIADKVDPELFVPALGLVLAFVLAFVSGHLGPWGKGLARFLPVPQAHWARGRVWLVQAILAALSVGLYFILLRLAGMSLAAAFLQPTDFRAVTSAEGLFYISGLLLWSMWAIFFLEMIRRAPDGFTPLGLLTLAALAGVFVVFTLPFGARGFVLGPLIGILWVMDMAVLRRRLSLAVVTPICFVVAVFVGGYGVYRDFNAGFSSDRYLDEAITNALGSISSTALRHDSTISISLSGRSTSSRRSDRVTSGAGARRISCCSRFREVSCRASRHRHPHS